MGPFLGRLGQNWRQKTAHRAYLLGVVGGIIGSFALGACAPVQSGRWYDSDTHDKFKRNVQRSVAYDKPQKSNRGAPPAARRAKTQAGTITVAAGDTYFSLARRHKVSLQSLVRVNRAQPPYALSTGQRLTLPSERLHEVQKGETLYAISRRYDVTVTALARQNNLSEPFTLKLGAKLAIPNSAGRQIAEAQQAAPADARANARQIGRSKPNQKVAVAIKQPAPKRRGRFIKPVSGRVISDYGPKTGGRHNDGINIAAPRGAPVKAAENGIVVYAGNELKGYGNLILIRHSDGWVSAYAHLDQFAVKAGARVKQGQQIGRVGNSGSVSEPQVHFEIRKGARAVNPAALIS